MSHPRCRAIPPQVTLAGVRKRVPEVMSELTAMAFIFGVVLIGIFRSTKNRAPTDLQIRSRPCLISRNGSRRLPRPERCMARRPGG